MCSGLRFKEEEQAVEKGEQRHAVLSFHRVVSEHRNHVDYQKGEVQPPFVFSRGDGRVEKGEQYYSQANPAESDCEGEVLVVAAYKISLYRGILPNQLIGDSILHVTGAGAYKRVACACYPGNPPHFKTARHAPFHLVAAEVQADVPKGFKIARLQSGAGVPDACLPVFDEINVLVRQLLHAKAVLGKTFGVHIAD